jgi:hypothetical protein
MKLDELLEASNKPKVGSYQLPVFIQWTVQILSSGGQ